MKEVELAPQQGLTQDGVLICNFSLDLDSIYYWADGPKRGEAAFLRLIISSDTARYEELIRATGCSRLSFLRDHSDLWVSRKGRDVLNAHIAGMIAKRIQGPAAGWAFSQTGFHCVDNRMVFVAGDRLIGGGGLDAVFSPDISRFHLMSTEHPPEKITEELLNRLQANGPEVAVPVFAFGILTALQSLVLECGIPLTSVLYLSGWSGLGKTETVKRFFAVYNLANTDQPALITEAGSTMAGFRENLRSARDLPVVLDDLCLSSARDSQRKRLEVGAQAVREASNKGAVRTRAGEHGQEPSTEAGVAITAEFDLGTISDVTRCIIVRLDHPMKGGRPDDRAIAAQALDAFLTWFVPRYHVEKERLQQCYEDAAAEGRLDRLKTGLFCLRWAFDCFLRFVPDVGALGETEYRQTSQFLDMILQQMEASQRRLLSSIDAKTPKASIPELHWAGIKEQTIPLDKKLKKLDSIHALIRENDLFGPPILLETFFSAQEGYQGTTRNKISHELKAAGILVLHEKDRSNTVKLKEGLPRMVHIRLDILEEIVAQPMISDSKGGIHENHPPASTHR